MVVLKKHMIQPVKKLRCVQNGGDGGEPIFIWILSNEARDDRG